MDMGFMYQMLKTQGARKEACATKTMGSTVQPWQLFLLATAQRPQDSSILLILDHQTSGTHLSGQIWKSLKL